MTAVVNARSVVELDTPEEDLSVDVWGENDLSDRLTDFSVSGHIIRIERPAELAAPFCKAVISFELYPALEQALNQYVARRHREILISLEAQQD